MLQLKAAPKVDKLSRKVTKGLLSVLLSNRELVLNNKIIIHDEWQQQDPDQHQKLTLNETWQFGH